LLLVPALLSLIVGVLGALESNKIKRFLAYTAINQVGLLLIGVYVDAIDAVLFYLFCYVLTTIAFFILFNATTNMNESGTSEMVFISDLNNFAYYNPIEKAYLIIILFAMGGLPPFVTAVGK
jgi:NADH:ubiquinone oxidoreductase subunit 2 (subunit N)